MCVQEQINYLDEIVENIPDKYTDNWGSFEAKSTSEAFRLRETFLKKGMYALVSWQWVKPFAEWIGNRRCLEVMAGRGWLSLALQSLGTNVIATDDYSWPTYKEWGEPVTGIEKIDTVEAVKNMGKTSICLLFLGLIWTIMLIKQ